MRRRQFQSVEQPEGVCCHVVETVGGFRLLTGQELRGDGTHVRHAEMAELLRQARIPIVEADHIVVAVGELGAELVAPVDHLRAETHDEQQRPGVTVAEGVVLEGDTVGGELGHGSRFLVLRIEPGILPNGLRERNNPGTLPAMKTPFPDATLIELGDVTLETFTAGPADGRPVVLCHGWPEHAFSWRHQIPVLADAGYHVIVPNQRGYGASSRPEPVTDYDIEHLTGDLAALLDHFGHQEALFVGHDWGAIVVWNMALLHPERVSGVINLSVPFMERGETPWVDFWEQMLGGDFYIVHFNRQPGVADAAFAASPERLLRNLYRTNQWRAEPVDLGPGMPFINMASVETMPGELMMSEEDLAVFVDSFKASGFTGGINWYRNFNRNWEIVGRVEQKIGQPTLMIYGAHDMVPPSPNLGSFVADLETATLDCGHWIQQERPAETNSLMLDWLGRRYPA